MIAAIYARKSTEQNGVADETKYLLTGFVACGECGSGMHVARFGAVRSRSYFCTWHRTRGATVCRNGLGAPLAGPDDRRSGEIPTTPPPRPPPPNLTDISG